ncbi:type II toxin-antitoxin system VapC family toxin [soil metagenome]
MRVYVDSSALVKRVIDEPESSHLISSLETYSQTSTDELHSSTLAWVEVSRTIRARTILEDPLSIADFVDVALSGILSLPISDEVVSIARRIAPPLLRSLDAIHLASAALIDADLVVAYDVRLLSAARELGFATASPGSLVP